MAEEIPASDESEEPADQTAAWRLIVFKHMGFAEYAALLLAQNKTVDTRKVEKALAGGCSLERALEIFL